MTTQPNESPRLVAQRSELETFLARSESLYRNQRDKLIREEQAYTAERFQLEQAFEQRARVLVLEREDALRQLDMAYTRSKHEGERVLAAVSHLREG